MNDLGFIIAIHYDNLHVLCTVCICSGETNTELEADADETSRKVCANYLYIVKYCDTKFEILLPQMSIITSF